MLLSIVKYPDPFLRKICKDVEGVNDEIRTLASNMFETMYAAPGVGLAAPQVGLNLRMLVMDKGGEEPSPRVVINPHLELSGETVCSKNEGCLSVPLDFRADVMRKSHVHLTYRDLDWNFIDVELDGFEAIIVQHEADHLDGVLFIDKINRVRRMIYDNKVKKWMRRQKKNA